VEGTFSYDAAHHRWTGYCEQAGVEIGIHQLRHAHATELINNGVSIEADAVLGLTARIQRFGGYATDEVTLAPEPFDAATTGPDLRYRSGPRACPHWARLRKWSAVTAKLSCCRIADDRRPGKFFKEIRRRCRIGAVVFVVRVRPPTRGGAKGKESRL
jgi:hypothetical protein